MGTFKDVYDILKDLLNWAKESGKQELVDLANEIQADLFNMREENQNLKEENRKLQTRLLDDKKLKSIEKDLIPHIQAFYTRKSDKIERLYCARCWDKEKNLIQLQGYPDWDQYGCKDVYCPECKNRLRIYKKFNDEDK